MTSPAKALHPLLTVRTSFGSISHVGVVWNRQKSGQPSWISPEFLALPSSWVGRSVPLLANHEPACTLFACPPPGGSPKKNGQSMISRLPSIVTLSTPRLIYLLCTKIRVVHTLGKLFPHSPGEIVVGSFSACRIRLHILRASDGKKHPGAVLPIIAYSVNCGDSRYSPADLSICGSQVCLCPKGSASCDTLVWNWTTGNLILVSFQVKITTTH